MCGILGISGNFSQSKFLEGLRLLDHRGPDGSNTFFSNSPSIALGHVRLAILDTSSNGLQPMTSACGQFIIVFNGEIYNFMELKEKYFSKDFNFQSGSDTEVLLELFAMYGESILSELDGIFSFCIFSQQENVLTLVRDKFGVKPLYFFSGPKNFIFSSEVSPILKNMNCEIRINERAIIKSMRYLWNPEADSYFKGIKKLDPGSLCKINLKDQSFKFKKWIDLPILLSQSKKLKLNNKQLLKDKLVSHLENAVTSQMISDVPLGAFLSGGMDSSAIVYFAKKLNPQIECFTIKTSTQADDGFDDDLPYAEYIAKHLKLNLNVLEISSDSLIKSVEKITNMMSQPIADPAIYNTFLISEGARKKGIKVLLSGTGGDDIFTGYRRHQAIKLEQFFKFMPSAAIEYLPLKTGFKRRLEKFKSYSNNFNEIGLSTFLRWISPDRHLQLIDKKFHHILLEKDNIEKFYSKLLNEIPNDKINQILALEQRFFLGEHNLLYTDMMSMAAGVEVRVPFLANELTEFAASIPSKYQQTIWRSKNLFKESMEGRLPSKIIYRPKTGFGAPLRQWVQHDLKEYISDTLSFDRVSRIGIFNYKNLEQLISQNQKNEVDASYTIFQILTTVLWFEKNIENN